MTKHNINGIYILENGESNPQAIIFIHAFPLCNRMWDEQIKYFTEKYRIIVYDIRSFGYSESNDFNFTIDSHVDDLLNIINELHLHKPVICSLSMGGYIALRALELNQSLFKGAVLSDTKSEADTNPAKINRAAQIKQIKGGDRKIFTANFIKAALAEDTFTGKQEIVNFLEEMIGWQNDSAITGGLMTLASRTDTTDSLTKLDLPVQIIQGEQDKLIPLEFAKSMNGKIKGSGLAVIKNCGHFPNMENPEEFNRVIDDFLTRINTN